MNLDKILHSIVYIYRRMTPRTWFLVSLTDDCVMFYGTYKECDQVIDELPGDIYGIWIKKYLTPSMLKSLGDRAKYL